MRKQLALWTMVAGIALAGVASAEAAGFGRGRLAAMLDQIVTLFAQIEASVAENSQRVLGVQRTVDSGEYWQTQVLSKTVTLSRDVEFGATDRLRIIKVPIGQEGFLDQASCVVLDAPIWDEGGKVSVSVSVETPDGESTGICSLIVGAPFSFFAEFIDRPLKFGKRPLNGGETVSFSCRSFSASGERVLGSGCAVDVDLWLRLRTKAMP